jgi:hypothetical protein
MLSSSRAGDFTARAKSESRQFLWNGLWVTDLLSFHHLIKPVNCLILKVLKCEIFANICLESVIRSPVQIPDGQIVQMHNK